MNSVDAEELKAIETVIRTVNLGLKLVTFRLEVLLLSLLTCALFAWAVYDPSALRIVAAGLFGLFCLLVMQLTKEKRRENLSAE